MPIPALFRVFPSANGESIAGQLARDTTRDGREREYLLRRVLKVTTGHDHNSSPTHAEMIPISSRVKKNNFLERN